jgi:hypothetical protein
VFLPSCLAVGSLCDDGERRGSGVRPAAWRGGGDLLREVRRPDPLRGGRNSARVLGAQSYRMRQARTHKESGKKLVTSVIASLGKSPRQGSQAHCDDRGCFSPHGGGWLPWREGAPLLCVETGRGVRGSGGAVTLRSQRPHHFDVEAARVP